jgi:hypothetical protein
MSEIDEYPNGDKRDTYIRLETDEMKQDRLQKQEIRKEKKAEKEATMSEEEKVALLAKKEAAKLKRAETMKVKKEEKIKLTEEEGIEEELKKERTKLEKKEKKTMKKEKVSEIKEIVGPQLTDIQSMYDTYIKRHNDIGDNMDELKILIKDFSDFAKKNAISNDSEIAKYAKSVLLKQAIDWLNEYKLKLNK